MLYNREFTYVLIRYFYGNKNKKSNNKSIFDALILYDRVDGKLFTYSVVKLFFRY